MTTRLVTLARNLQQRKGRTRKNLAVAEGVRLVEEGLSAGIDFKGALVSPALTSTDRGTVLLGSLAAHAVPIEEIDERTMADIASTDTPQGVLVVFEPPRYKIDEIVPASGFPVLVLDGVQDPGNVGALLRTAFGLGSPGAILLPGTADSSNAKVLRAGMGASFRMPVVHAKDDELKDWIEQNDVALWVATTEGTPLVRVKTQERLALVVGNEGAGVRSRISKLACRRVSIPLARGAESLNVAVAAGILLYEVRSAN